MTALENALKFNSGDLAANRQGRLSESQNQRLAFQRKLLTGCGVIVANVAGSTLLVIVSNFSLPAIAVIGVSSFSLILLLRRLMMHTAIVTGKVVSTAGTIHKHIDRNEETYWYHVTVNGWQFNVNPIVYDAFVEGQSVVLYHLEGSTAILSAEVD